MTLPATLKIGLLAGFIGLAALADPQAILDSIGKESVAIVASAEARVGRPLTPVSVAGVARRTTRRCAAGVYNC
jgi:hypothetical protein